MKKTFYKILLLVLLFSTEAALLERVYAAETMIQAPEQVSVGQEFRVQIVLDTNTSLNAVEGSLHYDTQYLKLNEVSDGNSAINFWVEKPREFAPGIISFGGITPGGFSGKEKVILTLIFETRKEGSASFELQNLQAFKNDGQGSLESMSTQPKRIKIDSNAGLSSETAADMDPPEEFTPLVSNDPNVFEGKYFLIFATQDKGSGINRYELREGKKGEFISRESPYLLINQKLNKKIYVRAIDNEGNVRQAEWVPDNKVWYKNPVVFAIIIGLILFFLFLRKLWLKPRH